jgi:hypothetical protein
MPATIKGNLTLGVSGPISDHQTATLFELTIEGETDEQLEQQFQKLKIPGAEGSTLADFKAGKKVLFEELDAEFTLEVA